MRSQISIIDDIKRSIIHKKKFKLKNKNKEIVFNDLRKITKLLFQKSLNENMQFTSFKYKYLDMHNKIKIANYYLKKINKKNNEIIVTRKEDDGIYTTEIRVIKNRLFYFELVNLNEPPFQIWGSVGKMRFKRMFRKRVNLIRKEVNTW